MKTKVTTGILGAGRHNIATDQHLPACLKSELVDLRVLCDRLESVQDFAHDAGVEACMDYEQMLNMEDLDMIQVCTPDQFHCAHAEMALAAGKHVLLQKPPCINLEELDRLRAAAAKSPGKLKVILSQRRSLLSRSIKHYIDSGEIGELREIIIKYRGRRFPVDNPNSFYMTKESGGVWLHNGLHWLDEAFCYSGHLPNTVNVLSTRNSDGESQYLGEGPNYWSAVFPMGRVSFLFEYNTMLLQDGLPGGMQRILVGTEGEIRQNFGSNELVLYRKDKEGTQNLPLLDCKLQGLDAVIESFRMAIDDFAMEILDGDERDPKVDDTFKLFELLLAGLK